MRNFVLSILVGSLAVSLGDAQAGDFTQKGPKKWLAVASTKDLDMAIAIARTLGAGAQVVTSQNDYYGVIKGPYAAKTVAQVKKLDSDIYELPKDALLSDGARYVKTVWQAPSDTPPLTGYEIGKPAKLSSGAVFAEVKLVKSGSENYITVASGGEKNGPNFSFETNADGEFATLGSDAAFMTLDASLKLPQLVFTRYSGGAHCCTKTWIVEKPDGAASWSLVEGETIDGTGYIFEDVDGDGGKELLSIDNSFLYAFDSYAGSFAPLKISKLRNGILEDVTTEPAMQGRLKQDLAGMEYEAKLNPELWKTNGFLAGWTANKMRLGQGDEAWQTVLENMDKNSSFGPQECTSGQKMDDCPVENMKPIPVLKALADFLKVGGYGPLPDRAEALLN
jgi:serine protease Do